MQKELAMMIGTFFLGICGKIFWDWVSRKTAIPNAEDGYMDFEAMQKHCRDQQQNCTSHMTSKLELVITRLENRLATGDKLFESVQKTLRLHGRVLAMLVRKLERDDKK